MIANKKNMDEHYTPGVFAYSPATGEECSANPSDYWYLAPDDVLEDGEGAPMVLATRTTSVNVLTDAGRSEVAFLLVALVAMIPAGLLVAFVALLAGSVRGVA